MGPMGWTDGQIGGRQHPLIWPPEGAPYCVYCMTFCVGLYAQAYLLHMHRTGSSKCVFC